MDRINILYYFHRAKYCVKERKLNFFHISIINIPSHLFPEKVYFCYKNLATSKRVERMPMFTNLVKCRIPLVLEEQTLSLLPYASASQLMQFPMGLQILQFGSHSFTTVCGSLLVTRDCK